MYPPMAGTHPQDAFGHLNGYSAIYYTYVWSKAIALDLSPSSRPTACATPRPPWPIASWCWSRGGSEDANVLIQDFLGRPLSLDAFKDELAKKP
ncbi:MAG: M3 family metallopeptidase [Asticcacaulis sp.]